MLQTGIYPTSSFVDGKEGGTGAAPLGVHRSYLGNAPARRAELSFTTRSSASMPRDRIKLGASGKIVSAFDIAPRHGARRVTGATQPADLCFALGCIQSQSCHTDRCPSRPGYAGPHPAACSGG